MTAAARRIVVVGNGMAGFRFVQELLGLDAGCDITVVGDEPGGAYNRAQLPLLLSRAARRDSIELADPCWYAARGVRLVAGTARRVDRTGRVRSASSSAPPGSRGASRHSTTRSATRCSTRTRALTGWCWRAR